MVCCKLVEVVKTGFCTTSRNVQEHSSPQIQSSVCFVFFHKTLLKIHSVTQCIQNNRCASLVNKKMAEDNNK